ncbi:ATP-binding protein [Paenarthrobacter ureafaciens]|uniref:ATP-binding protein n=1 Tax=Paenarthrobacter ureafaciens TaxID=37931 RepID=UPI001C2BA3A9|nr:ATP-binding protein [Paenarthrobacter ureafaciens]
MNFPKSSSVDIRPEVNILGVLKHLNYKPWYALAEFVDNALASSISTNESVQGAQPGLVVKIDIDLDGEGCITITDNAFGISIEDFPRAFRAAELPPDRAGLSEFGMGMKSAASWFAKKWNVRTSIQGDNIQRSVSFDLENIIATSSHEIPIVETPALPEAHFTIVTLSGLNHRPQGRTLAKIKDHLRSIYRRFLRAGVLDLRLNGESLQYNEVEILTAPPAWDANGENAEWVHRDIEIDLSGGRRVTGFAALRAKGSTAEAGFALFRRGRLILGSYDEPYRPESIFGRSNTYVYQRLFGELELHGFDVSHTKDGFQWDDHETELLEALRHALRGDDGAIDLIRQANEFRAKAPTIDERAPIVAATTLVAEELGRNLAPVLSILENDPVEEVPLLDALEQIDEIAATHLIMISTESGAWEISLTSKVDLTLSKWLEVASFGGERMLKDGRRLVRLEVAVNFAHPFSRKFAGASGENSELLLSMAAAVSVALALGKKGGARSSYVLRFLNEVLRGSFSFSKGTSNDD